MARRQTRSDDTHSAYSGNGVRLALGRRWDGVIVHVATVPDGAACGCRCPACGTDLVSRQGTRRRHFAHAASRPGDLAWSCDGDRTTALHEFAQRLIAERKALKLPPIAVGAGAAYDERRIAEPSTFQDSQVECRVGGYRTDVALTSGGRTLHVEVRVTHACEAEKIEAIRAVGDGLLEINLSGEHDKLDRPDIEDWILHQADRKWLVNRHVDALKAEIAERERQEAERQDRRRRDAADGLRRRYRKAEAAALADDPSADPDVKRAAEGGWAHLTSGFRAIVPGFFSVHPDRLRAVVLANLLDGTQGRTAAEIIGLLRRRSLVNEELASEARQDPKITKMAGLPLDGAVASIAYYLAWLGRSGAARCVGDRWIRDASVGGLLREQEEREQQRDIDAEERRERIDCFVSLMDAIRHALPADVAADFEEADNAWRDAPSWNTTPLDIVRAGGPRWDKLADALVSIRTCIRDGTAGEAPSTLGLPHVGDAMGRGIARRRDRILAEQDRERERQEAAALELGRRAEERAASIRTTAENRLGDDAAAWLATVPPGSDGLPEDAARHSEGGLDWMLKALDAAERRHRVRLKALRELEEFAARIERDPTRRHYMLSGVRHELPSRVSLRAYCRDTATLEECKAILKPSAKRRR